MSLTVEEMLQIGVLSDVEVLAGEQGLSNRIVKTVVVIDVPNAGQWVRGGEFLLTSGYLFANDSLSFVDLVDSLAKKNAAALGVKIGRFLNKVPDEAIAKANKYDFPILKIPTFMNHVDIINPVLAAIVNINTNCWRQLKL
ncbi:PucR family transcriptional regulator ligand-binding domain-containing protein [Acetomicrobium sp.]|uniref:PucR family transcriptional regulator ligand-binding domain-containing protein n=1 Tax=Acetomicrobium sp. TaxID=1872099 RepID=UPI0028722F65|nr:PucR family transcriptional regulator ligand-binding domain-containing protein [Acetomicrobium sp.]MDR9768843.1 PucR family transcriptional regulator ligand-binding domain-containing protein [Acetomicrobium sp.]